MNIWLINHYSVPPQYYPLARTTNFAKYLMKNGYNVTIFAASAVHNSDINLIQDSGIYKVDTCEGISYVYIKTRSYQGNGISRIINAVEFARRLPAVCKYFLKPDIILSSSATPLACMQGIRLAKKNDCKCIAEISDLWPESFVAYRLIGSRNPFLKLMYWYEKQIYAKADNIIFTMEGGNDYIKDKGWDKEHGGPVDLNKVYHINNGVDLEVFNYNKEKYIIEDIDLDDKNTFKVVYTGSMRRANNVQVFVGIARIIQDKGCDKVRIIVYGDGDQRAYLENLAKEKNINNIVFKGKVDKKYIPGILSKSDLNIFTGHNSDLFKYGLSLNKMFDYMASGKPTISDVKCGYDNLEKYKCGITVKSDDPNSMSEGIIAFYNMDKNEYDRYCINALKAAQEFDFKNLTKKLEKIILKQ